MLPVLLDHLLADLANRRTTVTACPKMRSPVALLQGRKCFKKRAGGAPFEATHDLAGRQLGGRRDQEVDVVFADDPLEDIRISNASPVGRTSSLTRWPTSPGNTWYRYLVTQTQ